MIFLAPALLVSAVVPLFVVAAGDLKLDRVVAGRHCGDIPLELLDLAALVKRLQVDHKEQTDKGSCCRCNDKMVKFGVLFLPVLLTRVLHEEQVCSVGAERARIANVDVPLRELHIVLLAELIKVTKQL